MTYLFPAAAEPIRQGDIFYPLPRTAADLTRDSVLLPDGRSWKVGLLGETRAEVVIQTTVHQEYAILISQDCDAERMPYLSFNTILPLMVAYRGASRPQSDSAWVKFITREMKINPHLFYLPSDPALGFTDRMAVVFAQAFQVHRTDVESNLSTLRKGRLDDVALTHFRESLAKFYSRLAYDEWYPMTPEEKAQYLDRR